MDKELAVLQKVKSGGQKIWRIEFTGHTAAALKSVRNSYVSCTYVCWPSGSPSARHRALSYLEALLYAELNTAIAQDQYYEFISASCTAERRKVQSWLTE